MAVLKSRSSLFVALLLIGVSRHYGWDFFPAELKGMASKGLGGVAVLSLLWLLVWSQKDAALIPLAGWWSFEELQVIICSGWYMLDPWPVREGQAICSAKADIDLGAFGILAVAFLVWLSTTNLDRLASNKK